MNIRAKLSKRLITKMYPHINLTLAVKASDLCEHSKAFDA